MSTQDFAGARWHRSSQSDKNGGHCVEAATVAARTAIRDSQHREHGMLIYPNAEWRALLHAVIRDEL